MGGPEATPLPKPDRRPLGRRSRILIAALATWALVASVGFGWAWVQHQAEINATTNSILMNMGSEFLSASAATQSLLTHRSLSYGWNASIWLDQVRRSVGELYATSDGLTLLLALNLTSGSADCPYLAYTNILELAAFDPSLLNGTNPYILYFGAAENLTLSLGHNLWNIVGSSSGAPVQLGSSSVTGIRAEVAALYAASESYAGAGCVY